MTTIAPFGTWKSPISASHAAAGSIPLTEPRIDGDSIYWLEGRATEAGRMAAVCSVDGKPGVTATPMPFNVRTRVHEYGGGAYLVAGGTVYFSNFADNLLYALSGNGSPWAITQNTLQRHADFVLDAAHKRLIAMREDHTRKGEEAKTSLVAISVDPHAGGAARETTLASGCDFYAAPRLSPDGKQLAWLNWNHPLMPWNGTELWLADVQQDGKLGNAHKVAGGPAESLCQPLWSPDGKLYVVSDRSNWWNLYRLEGEKLIAVCPMDAEFGRPQWVFGQSMYGFTGPEEITAIAIEKGICKLLRIDLASGEAQLIATPFTDMDGLVAGTGFAVMLAGSPTMPQQVVCVEVETGKRTVLAQCVPKTPDVGYISAAIGIDFPTTDGAVSHAFYHAPKNKDYTAPEGTLPPLIVFSHGGPTGMTTPVLRLSYQFWTSRGFAVLDVNYRGSTGFGRGYREALYGQWGIVDTDDCVEGARHMVKQGLADGSRLAIRGGSAGGYATLCALTFHDLFKVGASYFGVGDLKGLDDENHKFESQYNNSLLAPFPERNRLYLERSPIHHTERLKCPVIFFQGLDDKVVPPVQSETMVEALKSRGIPVAYMAFEGEGHGFRREQSIRVTLEAELYFYATVFGFEAADSMPAVEIFNREKLGVSGG
jgi:dipeptidyl aminopeptidase/acylaminoacyl peptidase